jgi:RHS repeat-associated protein
MVITAPDAENLKVRPVIAARGDDSDRPDDDPPAGSALFQLKRPNPPTSPDSSNRLSSNDFAISPGMQVAWYGYRFYDPVAGRWPSRDPLAEEGGLNLYGFLLNTVINDIDYLGLEIGNSDTQEKNRKWKELKEKHTYRRHIISLKWDIECINDRKVHTCCPGPKTIEAKVNINIHKSKVVPDREVKKANEQTAKAIKDGVLGAKYLLSETAKRHCGYTCSYKVVKAHDPEVFIVDDVIAIPQEEFPKDPGTTTELEPDNA